jgi:hypothetical protein
MEPRAPFIRAQSSTVRSALIKLEREITGVNRTRRRVVRTRQVVKNRTTVNKLVLTGQQNLTRALKYCRFNTQSLAASGIRIASAALGRFRFESSLLAVSFGKNAEVRLKVLRASYSAFAVSFRKSTNLIVHRTRIWFDKPKASLSPNLASAKKTIALNPRAFEGVILSISLGLIGVCGIVILVLLVQIRDLTANVSQGSKELAATKMRLTAVEKYAHEIGIKEQNVTRESAPRIAQPARAPVTLGEADMKVVRQFIKVLPPKSGGQQTLHVGDDISQGASAPVPESLVDKLPKLRGAKFSIDEDGAIILIGNGSRRVDAVVPYN